jgi:hypothetical protein
LDALALSAISNSEIPGKFETDAHKTLTFEHGKEPESSRNEEREINCASHKSGSIARTSPSGPASAAAQKLNNPTFAPISQTTDLGFTNSSAMV